MVLSHLIHEVYRNGPRDIRFAHGLGMDAPLAPSLSVRMAATLR